MRQQHQREHRSPPLTLSVATAESARTSLDAVDTSLAEVAALRGEIGASMARIEAFSGKLQAQILGETAAESRIRDSDVAADAAEAVRLGILQQAGASVLAQANIQPNVALQLLQG